MTGQVKDMHDAFPYGLALESFDNSNNPAKHRAAVMQTLDSLTKFVRLDFHQLSFFASTKPGFMAFRTEIICVHASSVMGNAAFSAGHALP
jgi:hypothetical protein